MSLTRTEQHLICGLKVFEVKTGMAMAIIMTLQDEDQMWEMMEYMAEHKGATADELLDQARRIAGTA